MIEFNDENWVEMKAFGKRCVKAMKGMLFMCGMTIMGDGGECELVEDPEVAYELMACGAIDAPESADDYWWPDLTDPATLGCLLALTREAWGCSTLHVFYSESDEVTYSDSEWVWQGEGANWMDGFDTEIEALVAALEAAP